MADPKGEDRVAATANHILRTLSSSQADDMMRILSTFDDRFSRFSMSSIPSSTDSQDQNLQCPEGKGKDSKIIEKTPLPSGLKSAEEIIMKWDSNSDQSPSHQQPTTFLWSEDRDEARRYLDAVDKLHAFIESMTNSESLSSSPTLPAEVATAYNALQLAMLRLEAEFCHILRQNREPADPESLFDLVSGRSSFDAAFSFSFSSNNSSRRIEEEQETDAKYNAKYNVDGNDDDDYDEHDDENEGKKGREREFDDERGEEEEEETAKSRGLADMTLDLLPSPAVSDLFEIASRMVQSGYESECAHAYIGIRKGVLEDSLGHEKFSFEEVQRMPWEHLENEINKWVRTMKVAIRCLFPSEKQLAERIFAFRVSVSDLCFTDVAKPILIQLFNFGEAIAISRRSSEKLFKILNMYECLNESISPIETMFVGEPSETLRHEALAILNRLGDAAWGTFVEFENAIQHETSKNVMPFGNIHPLTRYVMNYMSLLSEYSDTMNQLLSDRVGNSSSNQDDPDRGPLSHIMLSLVENLERNLDAKAKLYKDLALASLFLMNNAHYISQKIKSSELVRKLLGDEWIRRNNGKLRQYHNNYRRTAWTKVLSYLKDEGISISGGTANGATRNVIKEKFKSFNAAFEENIKIQSNWVVPDPQLCTELRISVTEMLLPAYRSFLGRFQIHLDALKHPERYVKYSPEDVENHLNELFEGAPGSSNRRKSFPAAGNTM